jgi:transmembrane sensor
VNSPTEEAVEWLMRLGEDDSPACRSAFYAWVNQSPRHIQEFLQATEISRSLQGIDANRSIDIQVLLEDTVANVISLGDGATAKLAAPKPRIRKFLPFAAATVAAVTAAVLYWDQVPLDRSTFATAVGEQRTIKLSDGSMLTLNTRSQIRVEFNQRAREIRLADGEALFSVAHDPRRPFRVVTSAATIQAIGTQFDVHHDAQGTTVAVIEGAVHVAPPARSAAQLSAGEEAHVTARGQLSTRPLPDPRAAVAWRERRLEFHDIALAEVAAEFNRYNTMRIRVQGVLDPDKRITGIFSADNPEALVRFLEHDPSLRIERGHQELIIHSREDR